MGTDAKPGAGHTAIRLSADTHAEIARCLRIVVDSAERATSGNVSHERGNILAYAELAQRYLEGATKRARAARRRKRKESR